MASKPVTVLLHRKPVCSIQAEQTFSPSVIIEFFPAFVNKSPWLVFWYLHKKSRITSFRQSGHLPATRDPRFSVPTSQWVWLSHKRTHLPKKDRQPHFTFQGVQIGAFIYFQARVLRHLVLDETRPSRLAALKSEISSDCYCDYDTITLKNVKEKELVRVHSFPAWQGTFEPAHVTGDRTSPKIGLALFSSLLYNLSNKRWVFITLCLLVCAHP